jgi:DNA (cytosine-5)-methyltransferase 1
MTWYDYVYKHGSLFSGIGGFDLAAQEAGFENEFQVEWDEYCLKVLAKNFKETQRYGDIREFDGSRYAGAIDIISGGFPCQPFSVAGLQKGSDDDRHLWPEMLRVIREIQPIAVLGENVTGIIGMELDNLQADLESEGYQTQAFVVPACAVGAWHQRNRVWIVGYSDSIRQQRFNGGGYAPEPKNGCEIFSNTNGKRELQQKGAEQKFRQWAGNLCEAATNPNGFGSIENSQKHKAEFFNQDGKTRAIVTNTDGQRCEKQRRPQRIETEFGLFERGGWWQSEPPLGRVANGIPNRVDRLKGLGNAIVPQVAYQFFIAIKMLIANSNIEDYGRAKTNTQ